MCYLTECDFHEHVENEVTVPAVCPQWNDVPVFDRKVSGTRSLPSSVCARDCSPCAYRICIPGLHNADLSAGPRPY